MQLLKNIQQQLAWYKVLKFRQRYFISKSNILRIRFVLPIFLAFILSAVSTLVALENSQNANTFESFQEASVSTQTNEAKPALERVLPNNFIDLVRLSDKEPKKPENDLKRRLEVRSGQTLAGILQNQGVSGNEAYLTVKALSEHIDPRKIKPGQSFNIELEKTDNAETPLTLAKLTMDIDSVKSLNITRQKDAFEAAIVEKEVTKYTYAGTTQIQTSLYGSAARSGIPAQVIAKMIRMYSWSVDFQRDIRKNDEIELLYEVYKTKDGDAVKFGDILYANLNVMGTDIPLYRFEKSDGHVGYYDSRGQSIKKTLMRTPVDGARVSSGYGMRRHPILGYNKMHKGVDFAAPLGTPIYAAGDGVLEEVGRKGAYGNYMRIRHNGTLKTAYAHLHKFAKGMRSGKRVKQGEVIGYIGSTGRSTGPHLHYEVLLNGKQVNPNRVDLPVGESLKGKELKRFKTYINKYNKMYVDLLRGQKFASNDNKDDKKKSS